MQTLTLLLTVALISTMPLRAAGLLDKLGLGKGVESADLSALSQDQVASGLKEALVKGVEHAVANLGRADGFLKDAAVRIPLPDSLRKVESGLRAVGQSQLADDFISTMNRAAEQAVPQAASVLGDSVRQMTVADAKSILTATNMAATEYFKRTAGTNLYARFLPIVKQATEKTGVTAAYKKLTEKGNVGGFSGFGGFSLKKDNLDLDAYVTHKALDGLFAKIAEQEKLIRENPAARTTALLQNVFGALKK